MDKTLLAVEREVFEESGLKVKAGKIAAVFDDRKDGYKAGCN